jgi:hypothetical protein
VSTDAGLHVQLSRWERWGALHRPFTVPWAHVVAIAEVDDVWARLRGMRAPGTGWPGRIMLGTTRYSGGRDFCAVYRHRPGFIVQLRDEHFARLLITAEAGEAAPAIPSS